jgi:hypothetical protein
MDHRLVFDMIGVLIRGGEVADRAGAALHKADVTIIVESKAESAVRQAVTTRVFPNCGMGLAPAVGEAPTDIQQRTKPFDIDVTWRRSGRVLLATRNEQFVS